jgi:hypothetical protein
LVPAVDRLARKTGSDPVPEVKQRRGYTAERDKFGVAGLTPLASETVRAPRIAECQVQMEAVVAATHELAADNPAHRGRSKVIEVRIQRVHADERILVEGVENRIDPDRWRPLIMSFQHFYGLRPGKLQDSTLAQIPEHLYRSPDVDRARLAAPSPRMRDQRDRRHGAWTGPAARRQHGKAAAGAAGRRRPSHMAGRAGQVPRGHGRARRGAPCPTPRSNG